VLSDAEAVALCVHGDSLWHRLGLSALGVGWEERDGVARRTGDASVVFLGAMTLVPEVTAEELDSAVAGRRGRVWVRDSHAHLDLSGLGWIRRAAHPWMLRPRGPFSAPVAVDGLSVVPARTDADVRTFERTIFTAADGSPEWAPPGTVHPAPESLDVAGLTLLTAWLDGEPVGTAAAAVDDRVVEISAVSVLQRARRRGVGTALTAAAAALAPELPAALDSTELGHGVYLGLGFGDVGMSVLWERREQLA
jgi:GNAT superfamily N-acetyltransferase